MKKNERTYFDLWRRTNELTQADVSRATGVPKSEVSRLCRNMLTGKKSLDRLSEYMGIDPDELLSCNRLKTFLKSVPY